MRAILQVRKVAEDLGYNQTRLQKETRLNMGVIQRYWHNKVREVSFDVLEKIADVLHVGIQYLITDIENAEMEETLDGLYRAIQKTWLEQPTTKDAFARGLSRILSHQDLNARLQYELIDRFGREYAILHQGDLVAAEAGKPAKNPDEVTREMSLMNEIMELDKARRGTMQNKNAQQTATAWKLKNL